MRAPALIGWLALAGSLASTRAVAADVVLYDGEDPGAAVAAVAGALHVAEDTLRPVRLTDLTATRPPLLSGAGEISLCTGAPTQNADVEALAGKAQKAVLFMEYGRALADLDAAFGALGCLMEPADAAVAARVMFMRGIAQFHQGDAEAARASFRQAHLFEPGLQWDEEYAPAPREVFDAARDALSGEATQVLRVVPGPETTQIHVDGRQIARELRLAPGDHLVQVGGAVVSTVRVDLAPQAPATLLLPALVPPGAVGWPADEARGAVLSTLLGAVMGEGFVVYTTRDGGVWRGTSGASGWEQLAAPAVASAEPASPAGGTVQRTDGASITSETRTDGGSVVQSVTVITAPPPAVRRPTWALAVPGFALAVGGAVAGVVGHDQASTRYDAALLGFGSAQEHAAAKEEYDRWRVITYAGYALAGTGGALALTGLAVRHPVVTAAPLVGPGGTGLSVTWTPPAR